MCYLRRVYLNIGLSGQNSDLAHSQILELRVVSEKNHALTWGSEECERGEVEFTHRIRRESAEYGLKHRTRPRSQVPPFNIYTFEPLTDLRGRAFPISGKRVEI